MALAISVVFALYLSWGSIFCWRADSIAVSLKKFLLVHTSATGLIIGLVAYVGHNYISTQIDKVANKMETASADFLDILQESTHS